MNNKIIALAVITVIFISILLFTNKYRELLLLLTFVAIGIIVLIFTLTRSEISGGEEPSYNKYEKSEINKVCKGNPHKFTREDLFLNFKKYNKNIKYYDTNQKPETINVHDGQRKLLLNEIYFLTEYGHLSKTVVYAGSAPGHHIKILLKMFGEHTFILWDPRNFDADLYKTERVKTNNSYFTNESAKLYANKNVLFISDIRLSPEEEQVAKDMDYQKDWVRIIKPKAYMLKFRLPWDIEKKKTKYLKGEIMIQPFAPKRSSETRLIGTSLDEVYYSITKYDSLMYYHNVILRQYATYKLECTNDLLEQRNKLWDTVAEIAILNNYLTHNKSEDICSITELINSTLMGKNTNKLDPKNIRDGSIC